MINASLRKKLYLDLLSLLYHAHVGHIGSCLSCVDLLAVTIIEEMDLKQDRLILSKGHAAATLYTILHHLGKISDEDFHNFHQNGSKLGIHPSSAYPELIPLSTGSLGHGLSFSAGIALIAQREKSKRKVFCITSDGDCNVGQTWEAAAFASQHQLNNLIVLIDRNQMQAFGKTKEVLGAMTSKEKWQAFGFETISCNGHNLIALRDAFSKVKKSKSSKPKAIICRTVKGFGVHFMENTLEWHYWPLEEDQYKEAVEDINNRF